MLYLTMVDFRVHAVLPKGCGKIQDFDMYYCPHLEMKIVMGNPIEFEEYDDDKLVRIVEGMIPSKLYVKYGSYDDLSVLADDVLFYLSATVDSVDQNRAGIKINKTRAYQNSEGYLTYEGGILVITDGYKPTKEKIKSLLSVDYANMLILDGTDRIKNSFQMARNAKYVDEFSGEF